MGLRKLVGFEKSRAVHGVDQSDSVSDEKNASTVPTTTSIPDNVVERNDKEIELHPDEVTEDAQLGQKKAEAAALVWPKKAVYATYAWIWVCFFMLALQQDLQTAYVLSTIIGGVLKLPIAKVLNVWGRAEGFFLFICVYIIGMIVLASCKGPSGYVAGYTLYWIGYDAIYLIMDVFVADTSGLRNRAFAFAFIGTPFICTAFTAPLLGAAFVQHTGWRWGYGAFCVIQFFVFMPLVIVFKFYQRKAEKMGLFKRPDSGRTMFDSFMYYFHEFDVVGAVLLMAAFTLFLLPFSLNTYGRAQYSSATFIAMVVVGVCLFPVFAIWEKYFAKVHFVRWELFKQRTVLGACCLAAILYFSFYSWETYFYPFLLVVYNLNLSDAGYMLEIFNVGSTFWGVIFGIYVRYAKHFKYACLCFGLPLLLLGAGLMIHFRGSDHGIGYIVMCQLFIAFANGTLVIGEDMAVMAAADRDGVPMMLSLVQLSANVGGSIGYAVAAAIYDNTFLPALESRIPADELGQVNAIYIGGYLTQLKYPMGSPTRDAINYAWGQSQKYLTISATCILILGFPAVGVWKNYNVDKKQNKGTVI